MATNFPKNVPHKLHLVTLMRSGIRRPWWEKRAIKKLGLTKRMTSIVLKNTPETNEILRSIKTLIKVQPVVLKNDDAASSDLSSSSTRSKLTVNISDLSSRVSDLNLISDPFINEKGEFEVKKYEDYLESFPEDHLNEVLSKSHYEGSELMNRDFYLEEEARITEKGEKIELYFKKKTWNNKKRQENRLKNLTKY